MAKLKHLSTVANDVVHRCARKLNSSVDALVEELDGVYWKPAEHGDYSRKFVIYCCSKVLREMGCCIQESIGGVTFSRFTFDMMLAWQTPSIDQDHDATNYSSSAMEMIGKENEDRKRVEVTREQEDVPLFYSDIMPLLVDHGESVREDAFVWLAALLPLSGDMVNGRFTFETLTASTANVLHFPAYDKYLKEIHSCVKHLQKQETPKGVELADDEFILHVEGTMSSQRVVRHIGGTSWPGRLTLTNYALYFEASGSVSYEDALIIDLSDANTDQCVKPAATGPWGAPLFDKAIMYQSSRQPEDIVIEFPELTSSTRRDHWLALTKEIILLHHFLSNHKTMAGPIQAWEIHARMILGIIRLHAAREMLRMSPPTPKTFLLFTLLDELPKGDYVLEELARTLMNGQEDYDKGNPCSASSLLRSLNMSHESLAEGTGLVVEGGDADDDNEKSKAVIVSSSPLHRDSNIASLESAITEARDQAKEIESAKSTTDSFKEEGIADSVVVLVGLLRPVMSRLALFQEVLKWERPGVAALVLATILFIIYKEWVGNAIAVVFLWVAGEIFRARWLRLKDKYKQVIVCAGSDQSAVDSIVSAQHRLQTAHEMVQTANIAIMKMQSIFVSRPEKHANVVMMAMVGMAILLIVVPFKFFLMAAAVYLSVMTSRLGKLMSDERSNRRLKEWWDSIPVVPVHIVDTRPGTPEPEEEG